MKYLNKKFVVTSSQPSNMFKKVYVCTCYEYKTYSNYLSQLSLHVNFKEEKYSVTMKMGSLRNTDTQ